MASIVTTVHQWAVMYVQTYEAKM